MYNDSVNKIFETYIGQIVKKETEILGVVYQPRNIYVGLNVFRDVGCPSDCGGCCSRFSLDYIEPEAKPAGIELEERIVEGKSVFSYNHTPDKEKHYCDMINLIDGRCKIHGFQPFSCDFELLRFRNFQTEVRISTSLYGRCWNLLRVDGVRGGLCQISDIDKKHKGEVMRKMLRLKQWIDYFGFETRIDDIIEYVDEARLEKPLRINQLKKSRGFLYGN